MNKFDKELEKTEEILPEFGKLSHAGEAISIVNKYPKIDHPRIYNTSTGRVLFVISNYPPGSERAPSEMTELEESTYGSGAVSFYKDFDSEKELQAFIDTL